MGLKVSMAECYLYFSLESQSRKFIKPSVACMSPLTWARKDCMEFVAQQKVLIVLIPFSEGLSGLRLPFLYPFALVFITSDSSAKVSRGSSIFKNTLICFTKRPEDKLSYDRHYRTHPHRTLHPQPGMLALLHHHHLPPHPTPPTVLLLFPPSDKIAPVRTCILPSLCRLSYMMRGA